MRKDGEAKVATFIVSPPRLVETLSKKQKFLCNFSAQFSAPRVRTIAILRRRSRSLAGPHAAVCCPRKLKRERLCAIEGGSSTHANFSACASCVAHAPTFIPQSPSVPRAQLVKLPAPRAHWVWRVGTSRLLLMPYKLEVRGLLKGSLASTALLPLEGNALGDTWVVGRVPWV
jgi:hypothetical protein